MIVIWLDKDNCYSLQHHSHQSQWAGQSVQGIILLSDVRIYQDVRYLSSMIFKQTGLVRMMVLSEEACDKVTLPCGFDPLLLVLPGSVCEPPKLDDMVAFSFEAIPPPFIAPPPAHPLNDLWAYSA